MRNRLSGSDPELPQAPEGWFKPSPRKTPSPNKGTPEKDGQKERNARYNSFLVS